MPHFENINDYESGDPVSGRPKVIPIAPHSMGAQEYRPHKRETLPKAKDTLPPFPGVDVEPVSISQMEKEFRQAARADEKRKKARRRKGFRARWQRFLSLLGLASSPSQPKPRSGDRGNRTQKGGKRNRPPRKPPRGQATRPGNRSENRESSAQGGGPGKQGGSSRKGGGGGKSSGNRGSRGGRKRSGGGGSNGGQGGAQAQQGKPNSDKQASRRRPRRNRKPSGQPKPSSPHSKGKDS
ncbi:MAG: hypothetical protein GVY10_04670 [Verrucomicrobia bacterium]|jgi:hypothetical protein|nr:hypothetical protein [Verrucomicrobiota bacterium]